VQACSFERSPNILISASIERSFRPVESSHQLLEQRSGNFRAELQNDGIGKSRALVHFHVAESGTKTLERQKQKNEEKRQGKTHAGTEMVSFINCRPEISNELMIVRPNTAGIVARQRLPFDSRSPLNTKKSPMRRSIKSTSDIV
jgi:hypothetical protein